VAKEKNEEVRREVYWRAAEYEFYEKSRGWFWSVGIVCLLLIVIAFWQRNFFFAVFIAIAGAMVYTYNRRRPNVIDFKVTPEGVGIEKSFYEYDKFENFALRKRPGHLDEIVLKKKTMVNPFIRVPIDSTLAGNARAILAGKLPETEYQESLTDLFSDLLGF